MGNTKCTAGGTTRLRISAWVDPGMLIGGSSPFYKKGIIEKGVENDKPVIDDISLLTTFLPVIANNTYVKHNVTMKDVSGVEVTKEVVKMEWHRSQILVFRPGDSSGDAEREAWMSRVVEECHKRRIQCLVGIGFVGGTQLKVFDKWIKNPQDPTIEQFADGVVHFFNTTQGISESDGISFDIEGVTAGVNLSHKPGGGVRNTEADLSAMEKQTLIRVGDNLTEMYRQVAIKLGLTRLVAVAGGGMTSKFHWRDNMPAGARKLPGTQGHIIAQYRVAADSEAAPQANVMFRPMAYAVEPIRDELLKWHGEVIDYASTEGINHPIGQFLGRHAFQLGISTICNNGLVSVPDPDNPGQMKQVIQCKPSPKDQEGNIYLHKDWVHRPDKYPQLLRAKKSGLCFFPASPSLWAKANAEINKGNAEAGKVGCPLQIPITPAMAKRFP